MAESSLPIPASEAGGGSPESMTPTIASYDGDYPQDQGQKGQLEHIAVTVGKFLELRGAVNQDAMNVVFDQLCAEGAGSGSLAAPTVTQAAQSFFGVLNPIMNRVKAQSSRRILHNFRGAVRAGEMLLVIGKPGSGCTTFLKTLANMREEYKDVTGNISYGGTSADEMAAKRSQDIIFCAEDDDHFPTLTVAETLRFALRARSGPKASRNEIETSMKCLAKLVGLDGVLHTKVGNEYIRGVSGGERRRTSLAEAILTCARLILLDNPTNGLDSSTALEFIEMMRELTTQSQCVTAMSIYQGSEAILPYFDKVVVINSGRQIFYGKISEAKAYFQNLGFDCLPTTTTTDFLNSMSADPEARRVLGEKESQVPRTPEEFEDAFRRSQQYADLVKDVEAAEREPSLTRQESRRSTYALPLYHQIWHCAFRHFRILISDYSTWGIEAACIIIQSLVLGTLFRDQSRATQSFFILASSLFYTVLVPALQAMSEFGNTFAQRPLILKHKRYSLYRPSAYAFGLVFTDSLWKIIAIAYNIPQYFLTGFQATASNFFIWFLVVYIEHLALSMFFRSVAVFSPNMNRAVLPVGIFFNMYVLYTGLYVPPPQMQVWLGWLRYLNPLYYGFESVMINEFASQVYACSEGDIVPSGPGYSNIANQVCAVLGSTPGTDSIPGISYLEAQYGFQASHMWRNVGINAGLFVAFALCTGIGMERLKVPAGRLNTIFFKSSSKGTKGFLGANSDQENGAVDLDVPLTVRKSISRSHGQPKDPQENAETFDWRNINLDIKIKDGARRLLDNLSGDVKKGRMKALMGMSGAGKTTLLNMLAGRNTIGQSSGEVRLNGQTLPKSFSRYMGYVQQQDIHLPTQTIREALQMTARLRRSPHISVEEKNAYVETVIEWLEMEDIAEALIGVPGAGLNLEQRKRVTVGVEMAAKPEILFLDEPTSGLDGQSAASIIRLLRKLVDSGQAIVCTIHQPAAELIGTFDDLYLLARGGKLVYDGPLGDRCAEAIRYFEKHARPYGNHENPAEYFLEVVGAGSRREVKLDWPQLWTEEAAQRDSHANEKNQAPPLQPTSLQSGAESTYAVPLTTQLSVVLKRAWLFYWREPDYATSKLWMNVGNSLLNSLTYLQSPTTQRGIYNRVFSAFMSLIVGPPLGLQVEPRFVQLRDIFMHREKASLTYSWFAFVASAIIIELPYAFVTSLVYWLLWYFPVGYLYEPARAGYSFLMYELFAIFATSLAQLCATVMPNLSGTFMANGFFFMFCNTFAGTLSPKPVTPSGWSWYYNVSPLFYLGEGVTVDVLQDVPINCDPSEVSIFQPPNGTSCGAYAASFLQSATGYLLNPDSSGSCEYCRYKDGQSYYTQYGYEWSNRNRNIGIFIGFIAFNYTAVILITYLIRVKKWKKN